MSTSNLLSRLRSLSSQARLRLGFVVGFALVGSFLVFNSFAETTPLGVTFPDSAEGSIDVEIVAEQPVTLNLTPSTWQKTTMLPYNAQQGSALTIGNTIYVFGLGVVTYATPNADGTISQWQTNPHFLPYAGYGARAIQIGNFIYFVGGSTGISHTTSEIQEQVHIGKINSDGTIGPWVKSMVSPGPGPRYAHGLFAIKGADATYLYVHGGIKSSSPGSHLTNIVRAKVTSETTGQLGLWEAVGTSEFAWFNTAVIDKYAYLLGGVTGVSCGACGSTGPLARATIDTVTGQLGTFANIGSVPSPAYAGAGLSYAGKLYYHGGWNALVSSSDGFNSTVVDSTNGAIGPWINATGAPQRHYHVMAIIEISGNSYVYLIGGERLPFISGNTTMRDVWYSKLVPYTPPPDTGGGGPEEGS